jgi:phospholipase C
MNQYLKPQPKKLQSKIKHIVVLMLENRSFDNLLGWLYEGKEIPHGQKYNGLSWDLWNSLNNFDGDGNPFTEKVPIAQNGADKKLKGKTVKGIPDFTLPNPDPGEGYCDTNHQLFGQYRVGAVYPPAAINQGFVQNYNNAMLYGSLTFGDDPTNPRNIMTCYTPEQTPVLSELARSFAVCDEYHASIPSQTMPNRAFVHAGTSEGKVNNAPSAVFYSKTIFNQIQDEIDNGNADLSWKVYCSSMLSADEKSSPGKVDKRHFSLTRLAMTQLHDQKYNENFGVMDEFYAACKKGKLASYTFLEPNFGVVGQNDQHPPTDIRPGEQLMADIYNAVKSSPAFNETMLVITYDEHGGCYDHYAPPNGAKNPDPENKAGQEGFMFNRFGVRVPCVVINPYIKAGLIGRPEGYTPFDHTSIIKTVQNCFGLEPKLTPRTEDAPDLSCLLTLDKPRTDFPKVYPLKWDKNATPAEVNELHRLMAKMVAELTNNQAPILDKDVVKFVQEKYTNHFHKTSTKK